jgi:hypothetical protein
VYSLTALATVLAVLLFLVGRPHDAIQGLVPGLAGLRACADGAAIRA